MIHLSFSGPWTLPDVETVSGPVINWSLEALKDFEVEVVR